MPTSTSGPLGPDLTGPDAEGILAAALATDGGRLLGHAVHAVHRRPGDGSTVGHTVRVARAGTEVEEYVLVSTSRARGVDPTTPGLVTLNGDGGRVLVWRFPDDPALPGLRRACDPTLVTALVPGAGPVTALDLVGYRPLRRAVVRVVRDGRTTYVKVLRPGVRGGAAEVVDRHRDLRAAGLPVPEVLAATDDGTLVLAEATGTPLAAAVARDGAAGLGVDALVSLLDALPATSLGRERRPAWSDRAAEFAAALADTAWGARALAVADAVRERSTAADPGPVVPTHGDLHEGQLTVGPGASGWAVTGLLDVDTVGPGHRVDDLACLVAHAYALGPVGEPTAARWRSEARAHVDPDLLDVRAAGVLLSLVVGAAHAGGAPAAPGQDAGSLLAAAERLLAQPSSR